MAAPVPHALSLGFRYTLRIQRVAYTHFRRNCATDIKLNDCAYSVTTPIFYVNAAPHIGHLYTALLADASCRWKSLNGYNIKLVTGTDEHGLKIQKAAALHNLSPAEYTNQISQKYKDLFAAFDIGYTDFIRTTDRKHIDAVLHFWNRISHHLVKGSYSGWYCMSDEAFLTDSQVEELVVEDRKVMVSKESGHVCEAVDEVNYMFPLHKFVERIREWHSSNGLFVNGTMIARPIACQVISPSTFVSSLDSTLENVEDLSVSRSSERLSWGIPVPNDPDQKIYVWLDALVNYLTACNYPHMNSWPVNCHIVGKDILRFHAVYWPAFLMAAELPLPKTILCHSHWLVDDRKMSKSVGNVVDPMSLRDKYTSDGLRYFLLREGVPAHDGNYSENKMINYLNSELCNTLGNLLNRCTSASLNKQQVYPPLDLHVYESVASEEWRQLLSNLQSLPGVVHAHYEEYNFYKGVDNIMAQLRNTNSFMETMRPWELKDNMTLMDNVIHTIMENLRVCGILLQPVIPKLADTLLCRLGVPADARTVADISPISGCTLTRKLGTGDALYKRIQKGS